MKLTNTLRHMEFGRLGVFVRGIITYRLSPHELLAFEDPLGRLHRTFQRCLGGAIHTVPYAIFAWLLHDYVEKKYDQMIRKDPKDYANDQ